MKEDFGNHIVVDSSTADLLDQIARTEGDPSQLAEIAQIDPNDFVDFLNDQQIEYDDAAASIFAASLSRKEIHIENLILSPAIQQAIKIFSNYTDLDDNLTRRYRGWASMLHSPRLHKGWASELSTPYRHGAKSLAEMAAEIVSAQASHAVMAADEMVGALKETFDALRDIITVEKGVQVAGAPPVDPRESIQRNYIINLEDGKKYKQLTKRTLAKFGLTPAEYRKKWNFPAKQPLAAKALCAKRRKTAKALGLGEKLQKARKAKAAAAKKAKVKAKPRAVSKRRAARKRKKA